VNAYGQTTEQQAAAEDATATRVTERWRTYQTTTFRNLSRALVGLPPERTVVEQAEDILRTAGYRQSKENGR
jgi:hypothetical protein